MDSNKVVENTREIKYNTARIREETSLLSIWMKSMIFIMVLFGLMVSVSIILQAKMVKQLNDLKQSTSLEQSL